MDRLNALWFGDRLGYLEQLSIKTALENGHPYTLYSYAPDRLMGVPDGVELRNASEVMSDPKRVAYFEGKFKALGSDFFRYEILARSLGYWVDLDLIFLKPLDLPEPYVFGWEKRGSVNGAVLKIPAGSPMLEELRNIPERNWLPPFHGPRNRLNYYLKRMRGDVKLEDLPWGAAGPGMITHLVKKLGLSEKAQPIHVFYPIPYSDARLLYGPSAQVEAFIKADTIAIHMWHSCLGDLTNRPPPKGSYIAELCQQHDVI